MINWLSNHVDTIIIVGAIMFSAVWMNGKFNEVKIRLSEIQKEIGIIGKL